MKVLLIINHDLRATLDHWGYIPSWLDDANPKSAKEQLKDGYGSWDHFDGLALLPNDCLKYPGDPPLVPISEILLRNERIVLYPSSWIAIIQPDRSFEVSRMD